MGAPPLTAGATLYRSEGSYATVAPGSGIAQRWPFGPTNCDLAYDGCASTAQTNLDVRMHFCTIGPSSRNPTACYQSAQGRYNSDIATCQAQLLCSTAADCKQSPVAPYGFRCCPSGFQACGTGAVPDCIANCPPNKVIPINSSSCTCVCDPFLQECEFTSAGVQKLRDPATCACYCPPVNCPPTYVQDPLTCGCVCPSYAPNECPDGCKRFGTTTDCLDCGDSCGAGEGCCPPAGCVSITADPNCGYCGHNCAQTGQTCCGVEPPDLPKYFNWPGPHCSHLTTTLDCGACGNWCPSTKVCRPQPGGTYACQCPTGSNPCGADLCCPSGTAAPKKTACGMTPQGKMVCVCPSGKPACGANDCCEPGYYCSSGHCCLTTEVWCGGQCCPIARCHSDHCCSSTEVWCTDKCCPTDQCCNGVCCSKLPLCQPGGAATCYCTGNHCCFRTDRWCGNICCPSGKCCGANDAYCCSSTESCTNGHCCPTGLTWCPTGCKNLQTDPANCGICGRQCNTAGGQICQGGQCVCSSSHPVPCGPSCCVSGEICANAVTGTCATPPPPIPPVFCSAVQTAGHDFADTRVVEMGRTSGTFNFTFDTESVPDRMFVTYQNQLLYDSFCVGTGGSVTLPLYFSGSSSRITVTVQPNCSGPTSGTNWSYTVECPNP